MADQYIESVVIGAGQHGCGVAASLKELGRAAVVVEKAEIGQAWAHERWDSLVVGSGNRSVALPGWDYDGDDPDGFMSGREVARILRRYVAQRDLRVLEHTPVRAVECALPVSDRADVRFRTELVTGGVVESRNVVAAVGGYARPRVPDFAKELDGSVHQMHSRYYRNPQALQDGAVLVVGAGISGQQIADELIDAGRRVFLSVGRHGVYPRRYRGRDIGEWMHVFALFNDYVSTDAAGGSDDRARLPGLPVIASKDEVTELNLGTLADKGVVLVGSVRGAAGETALLDDNVVAIADEASRSLQAVLDKIDTGLRQRGFVAPEQLPAPRINMDHIANFGTALDLVQHGIATVIWCTGFGPDYTILPVDALDDFGSPVLRDGIFGNIPGLYIAGLPDRNSLAPTAISATVEQGRSIARQIHADHILRTGSAESVVAP